MSLIFSKSKFYYEELKKSLKQYCTGLSASFFHIGTRFILQNFHFKLRNQRMISALWTFSNLLLPWYLIFVQNVHFTPRNLKSIGGISYFQKKRNNSMTLGIHFHFMTPYHFWSRADKSKFGWYQIGKRIISKMPYCSKLWAIHQRIKKNIEQYRAGLLVTSFTSVSYTHLTLPTNREV